VECIPPRRSEYFDLKIRNFDKEKDNYYEKGKLVLKHYKTVKTYGRVEIDLKKSAPLLNKQITQYMKLYDGEYLLHSTNGNKLSVPQITQYNHQ
jgi:hypothetical protein